MSPYISLCVYLPSSFMRCRLSATIYINITCICMLHSVLFPSLLFFLCLILCDKQHYTAQVERNHYARLWQPGLSHRSPKRRPFNLLATLAQQDAPVMSHDFPDAPRYTI